MLFKNKSKKSVVVRFSILIPVMLIAFEVQAKQDNALSNLTSELANLELSDNLPADTTVTFTAVDTPPQPIGGMNEFYKFIGANYVYPKEAQAAKVEGRVLISFVVEVDGSLTEIEILRNLGYGTGEAAVAMLKKSPKWKPGIQKGKPVRVRFTLPLQLNPKPEAPAEESTPVKTSPTSTRN